MGVMAYAPIVIEVIKLLYDNKDNLAKQLEEKGISVKDSLDSLQNLKPDDLAVLKESEKSGVLKNVSGKEVIFAVLVYGIPFATALMKVIEIYATEKKK